MGRLPFEADEEERCRTRLEKFVFAFKYMHTFTEFPFMEDPMLGKLASAAELANLPVERLNKYEKDMIDELDRELQKEFAVEKGREEGREEARKELLEKLQSLGVSPDVIAKL